MGEGRLVKGLWLERAKIKKGSKRREMEELALYTDSFGISPSDSRTGTILPLFVFLSLSSFYF